MIEKIIKSEDEWKHILAPDQFRVMRERGTKAPFSCALDNPPADKGSGEYHCAACDLPLFRSGTKFDSGTGWPSFFGPIAADHIEYIEDTTHGMRRTEVRCARCESHLGHVFSDGPKPSGKRYCINSIALKFTAKKNEK